MQALARSLPKLFDETVESLEANSPLKAAYLNELLTPDAERDILLWPDPLIQLNPSVDAGL